MSKASGNVTVVLRAGIYTILDSIDPVTFERLLFRENATEFHYV